MKLEDIKVGMKVIPVNKSIWDRCDEWIKKNNKTIKYFKNKGYLFVSNIDYEFGIVLSDFDDIGKDGDFFSPEDLIPYEKEIGKLSEDVSKRNLEKAKVNWNNGKRNISIEEWENQDGKGTDVSINGYCISYNGDNLEDVLNGLFKFFDVEKVEINREHYIL